MGAVEPPFRSIAIVGLGLIGGSIALAVRQRWPSCQITAVDDKPVLDQALARRAVDTVAADVSALNSVDLIVLAAPVGQNVALLKDIARTITVPVVVTDVGGTKRPIVESGRPIPAHVSFVGGHPLGGSEKGGFEFARADLFARRPWILTPDAATNPIALEQLSRFVTGLDALPTTMNAEEHDRLMALVSHLPQLTVSALMQVVGRAAGEDGLPLAGQGLVDTTRLASSSASVWKDICASNADAIGPALDLLIERLKDVRADLRRGDAVDALFEDAGLWRSILIKGRE